MERTRLIDASGVIWIGQKGGRELIFGNLYSGKYISFSPDEPCGKITYYHLGKNPIIDEHRGTFDDTLVLIISIENSKTKNKLDAPVIYREAWGYPQYITCFVCTRLTSHKVYYVNTGDDFVYEISVDLERHKADIEEVWEGKIKGCGRDFAMIINNKDDLGILKSRGKQKIKEIRIKEHYEGTDYSFNIRSAFDGSYYTVLSNITETSKKGYYNQFHVYSEEGKLKYITGFSMKKKLFARRVSIFKRALFVYLYQTVAILYLDPTYKASQLGKGFNHYAPGVDCFFENKTIIVIRIPENDKQVESSVLFENGIMYVWTGQNCYFNLYADLIRDNIDKIKYIPKEIARDISNLRMLAGHQKNTAVYFGRDVYRLIYRYLFIFNLFCSN